MHAPARALARDHKTQWTATQRGSWKNARARAFMAHTRTHARYASACGSGSRDARAPYPIFLIFTGGRCALTGLETPVE